MPLVTYGSVPPNAVALILVAATSYSALAATEGEDPAPPLIYLIQTPDVVNASSTLIRVVDGEMDWRMPLGLHARYGANVKNLVTLAHEDGGRWLIVWDMCSGEQLVRHNLGDVNFPTLQQSRGGGYSGLWLDGEGKTVYTASSDPRQPPVLFSLDVRSGQVSEHAIPGIEPAAPQSVLRVPARIRTPRGIILVYRDGSQLLFRYSNRSFEEIEFPWMPPFQEIRRLSYLPYFGIVREIDGSVLRLTDAELGALAAPEDLQLDLQEARLLGTAKRNEQLLIAYLTPVKDEPDVYVIHLRDLTAKTELWTHRIEFPLTRRLPPIFLSPDARWIIVLNSADRIAELHDTTSDLVRRIDLSQVESFRVIPAFQCE